MFIHLIAVGQLKEDYWRRASREYEKRLLRYHRLTITEVADEKDPLQKTDAAFKALLEIEAERIRKKIHPQSHLICLAIDGKRYDSPGLSRHLERLESRGHTHLTVLIGGSNGLSPTLLTQADECWSFSDLTFPHQLMRVIFLEQLYRTARISHNEPYHK